MCGNYGNSWWWRGIYFYLAASLRLDPAACQQIFFFLAYPDVKADVVHTTSSRPPSDLDLDQSAGGPL